MKTALLGILLLLLITSALTTTATSEQNAKTQSNNTSQVSNAVTATENPEVTGHKINSSELEALKNDIGVYETEQNYSQLVDGYGTGMTPPTENTWAEIGGDLYSIDSVEYTFGSPAPAVDQSATPWFPPIGNQASQGSCVAWSVGYYVKTFQEAKEHGWDLSAASWVDGYYGNPTVSYQDKIISPAFIYNLINHGADGGSSYYDAMQLVCFVGACSWEEMPYDLSTYTAWPSEAAWTEAAFYRGNSSGFQYMSVDTESGLANLKNLIASGYLATISVDAYKYDVLTSADMWTLDNYNNFGTNHANTIVGYDDNMNYTENGEVHYGAFKVANSWGVGGWENDPDGFYWISYETMKQSIEYCMFYYDMINYEPELLATFEVSHQKRNECTIRIGLGNPNSPTATKSFSQYVDGGAFPFPQNSIVLDITEFTEYIPTIYGQSFFLRVYDGGTSAIGNVTRFAVGQEESEDTPCQTVNLNAAYLNVTPSLLGQILINTDTGPIVLNQKVAAGANVSLFFTPVEWTNGQFRLYLSRDNLSEVSTGDEEYTPMFNVADLNASAVTTYTSTSGAWQVGYNWVNGTTPTNVAGGDYFFKASADSSTFVLVSDTSATWVGAFRFTPTSGPAGAIITVEGYGFSANSTANITYLNPVTSAWVSVVNNTLTDASGHFTYDTFAPDLIQNQPAGDNSALFDAIVFRAQDGSSGEYYNASSPFNEYRRGLTQVGSAVAVALYGNNTDLTLTVKVVTGTSLTVAGKWFTPGDTIILWDGTYLDTATVGSAGNFSQTVTVPATDVGTHTITLSNGDIEFLVMIEVSPTTVSPDSDTSPSTTTRPSPTPTPTPSPSPAPSLTPSPQPTSTPELQPTEDLPVPPYVIVAAVAFALISAAAFILKKSWYH